MNDDIEKIVNDLKARGVFDEFRKECLSAVDTRPAFENLRQKIDGKVKNYLDSLTWDASLNRNQLREKLRRSLTESDNVIATIQHLVDQVIAQKATTYMLSRIDSHVQDYLGIKVEEPVPKEEKIVWPGNETPPAKKDEKSLWISDNWNEVKSEKKQIPSLSPSLVSSHSLSPPTSGPSDNESDDSIPPAPSPTSLISGEDSNSPHFFEENTSKSPENKSKSLDNKSKSQANIYGHISKEGKQSTDEQRPIPIDWGTSTSPPPERPFAHLGSFTTPSSEINDKAAQIKEEPKSPEPSLSSSYPSLPNKEEIQKEEKETRKENEDKEKSKGSSEPVATDLLSDVSSAHTSDLSDFDDPMSISSVEEADELKSKTESSEEKIEKIEKVEKVEKMEIVEKVDKVDKTQKMEKPEKQEKQEKREKTGKIEKIEKVEKLTNVEKVERTTKPVIVEKIDDVQIKKENDSPSSTCDDIQSKKQTIAQPTQSAQPAQSSQPAKTVKPEFEVIRSAPNAPVFDIRFQEKPKGSVKELMVTSKKSEDTEKDLKLTKTEKPSENVQKPKYVIPKIKKEPKGSRESSPASSRHNTEDSKSRKSQSSNKRKSDTYSSQRYDEDDLYKPRYSIPGSRRHRTSNN